MYFYWYSILSGSRQQHTLGEYLKGDHHLFLTLYFFLSGSCTSENRGLRRGVIVILASRGPMVIRVLLLTTSHAFLEDIAGDAIDSCMIL